MNWEELGFSVESNDTRWDDFWAFYSLEIYEHNELILGEVLCTNLGKSRSNWNHISYIASIE